MKEGFCDYLSKPIDHVQLENLLLRYLPEELVQYTQQEGEKRMGENVTEGNAIGEEMAEEMRDCWQEDVDTIQLNHPKMIEKYQHIIYGIKRM